jgi:2-furoyl-CoA dehydrogenase large subunit
MGEGGGAPLHAISAAIQDAIGNDGAVVRNSHIPPEVVLDLLHAGADAKVRVLR